MQKNCFCQKGVIDEYNIGFCWEVCNGQNIYEFS